MLSRYIKNTYIVDSPIINQVFMKQKHIPRDISWLSFNARVLQEANDITVPLQERIRFATFQFEKVTICHFSK